MYCPLNIFSIKWLDPRFLLFKKKIRTREINTFLGPSLKQVLFDILFIMSVLTRVLSKLNSYNLLSPSSDGNFSMAVISFVLLYPFWNEVASTWACMKALRMALHVFFFLCINTFSHPLVLFLCHFFVLLYRAGVFTQLPTAMPGNFPEQLELR